MNNASAEQMDIVNGMQREIDRLRAELGRIHARASTPVRDDDTKDDLARDLRHISEWAKDAIKDC